MHIERDSVEVTRLLASEFARRCVGAELPSIRYSDAHRWRYAQPEDAVEERHLYDDEQGIGVAGDWCGGPRIEGAFLSGLSLARRLLEHRV